MMQHLLAGTTIDILGLKSEEEVKQPAAAEGGDKAEAEGQADGAGPTEAGQEAQVLVRMLCLQIYH